jgi:hypothetical protein
MMNDLDRFVISTFSKGIIPYSHAGSLDAAMKEYSFNQVMTALPESHRAEEAVKAYLSDAVQRNVLIERRSFTHDALVDIYCDGNGIAVVPPADARRLGQYVSAIGKLTPLRGIESLRADTHLYGATQLAHALGDNHSKALKFLLGNGFIKNGSRVQGQLGEIYSFTPHALANYHFHQVSMAQ